MAVELLTPLGTLFAFAAVVPLVAFLARERHGRRVRETLGLGHPPRRSRGALVLALAALPLLAGAAAAQPVLDLTRERRERTDVEAFVVLDTSRSMLASAGPTAPTRFERARELTAAVRDALPEVPLGLASLTDRTLPHLFPTTDEAVFDSALATSLGIDKPGPRFWFSERATDLNALGSVVTRSFFSPDVERHVLLLFTDGESRDPPNLLVEQLRDADVELVLVPIWREGEQVYATGTPEPGYLADAEGPATIRELAAETGARLVEPESAQALVAAFAEAAGTGPTHVAAKEGQELPLMPYLALAGLLPVAFLLRRRNV